MRTTTTTHVLFVILIHVFVLLPTKMTTGRLLGQQQEQHGPRSKEEMPHGQHLQNHKRSHGHHHNENDVNNHHHHHNNNNNNNNNNNKDSSDNSTQDHGEVMNPPEIDTSEDEEVKESQVALPEATGGQEEEKQVEGGQEEDEEVEAEDVTPKMDCGSFLIRQTDSITIFDDFEEMDTSETSVEGMKELTCTELMSGDELCFGGREETAAFWVHGLCFRGRGHTSVTVSAIADDSEIVFACGGSPEATPSVECRSCEMPINGNDMKEGNNDNNNGRDIDEAPDCDFPFRAEARFGILSIPKHSEGRCVLICEMPTTNK